VLVAIGPASLLNAIDAGLAATVLVAESGTGILVSAGAIRLSG